ncbi:MAG: DegV family protein [Arenicella sp.]|jgi:fatty acid-binding protein DegV|nr:DegV family protein [Arenicella sp.]
MNYVLILDSVACLPEEEIRRRKLEIIPLSIIVEGKNNFVD